MQKKPENLHNIEAKYNFQAFLYGFLQPTGMKSCTANFHPSTSKYNLKTPYQKSDL